MDSRPSRLDSVGLGMAETANGARARGGGSGRGKHGVPVHNRRLGSLITAICLK